MVPAPSGRVTRQAVQGPGLDLPDVLPGVAEVAADFHEGSWMVSKNPVLKHLTLEIAERSETLAEQMSVGKIH
jgi:hypothetical protein